jgi:hypothetical protein
MVSKSRKEDCNVNSTIPGMAMGDERKCLNRIRRDLKVNSKTELWNGVTAGEFAIIYRACKMARRRHRLAAKAEKTDANVPSVEDMIRDGVIPEALQSKNSCKKHEKN